MDNGESKGTISELSNSLYDALTHQRDKLSTFFEQDSHRLKHVVLMDMFLHIKKTHNYDDGNIVSDLMLGTAGLECNKQKAIYEIPTYELMTTIFAIIEYFNVKSVEELMAGQGLFAALFTKYFKGEITFNATDGMCQCETFAISTYHPIEKKYIIEYLLEQTKATAELYITIWPTKEVAKSYVEEFIRKIRPKLFILVGQKDIYKGYFKCLTDERYKQITFIPYQLCYKDTVGGTSKFPDICHSCLTLFVREDIKDDIDVIRTTIMSKIGGMCRENEQKIDDRYLLRYFNDEQLIPRIINSIETDVEIKELMKYLNDISNSKSTVHIPEYLSTLQEFRFWYQLHTTHEYPALIKTYEKFREFKDIYDKVNTMQFTQANVFGMKNRNIFPAWVNNRQEAIKCIILDYSSPVKHKLWKQSKQMMDKYYDELTKI
jgi:hypothetical protein